MQEADGEHGVNKPPGGGVFSLGWRSRGGPAGYRWGSREAQALGVECIAGWRRRQHGAQGAAGSCSILPLENLHLKKSSRGSPFMMEFQRRSRSKELEMVQVWLHFLSCSLVYS